MNVNEFYNNNFDESARLSGNDNRHKVELYRKRFLYKYTIEHVRPKKIIQIACGTGVHTNWLCENYPDIEIYASDIIPKHVEQLNDYHNLHKRVWDCTDKLPEEYWSGADLVIIEGAWYHTAHNDRGKIINNIKKINPKCVIIDWLSAWHDTMQRLLQDKALPEDYAKPRPESPFVFETEWDLEFMINVFNTVYLYPVDMDLRFGFRDLNEVDDETFQKFINMMNLTVQVYDSDNTYLMNATEHGCYIVWPKEISC